MKKVTLLTFVSVTMLIASENRSLAQDKTTTAKKTKSGSTHKLTPGGPRGGGGQGGSQQDTTVVHPRTPGGRPHHLDSLHHSKMKKMKAN